MWNENYINIVLLVREHLALVRLSAISVQLLKLKSMII